MQENKKINEFIEHIEKYHLGSKEIVKKILAVYFSGGNLLLNDVPGTGKSHLSTIISKSIEAEMKRIQFTSDLMASDIVGVKIYDVNKKDWNTLKGPIFADIVFADEINRAPPQTQSALLEAMSERQVSLEGQTFKLPKNHFVIATQNPNEFDGTYILPEAQLDRFTACLTLGYLPEKEEINILMGNVLDISNISPVLNQEDVSKIKREIDEVSLNTDIAGLIVKILNESRLKSKNNEIKNGLSIRAGIALKNMAKSYSYLLGLSFVTPDIIFELAPDVLRHRLDNPNILDIILEDIKRNAYDKVRK